MVREISGIAIAFTLSILFGVYVTTVFCPSQPRRWFLWFYAPAVGLGLTSIGYITFRRPIFTFEAAMLLIVIGSWLRGIHRPAIGFGSVWSWRILLVLGCVAMAVPGLLIQTMRVPHGSWDGWAIWNAHARLLYRAGALWMDGLPFTNHGDYPLLTSASTARLWRYAGVEIPEAGNLVGLVFMFSGLAVLVRTVAELRGTVVGLVFGAVLLGTPFYLDLGSAQYADVPLSYFFLATLSLVSLCAEQEWENHRLLMLAGLMAGLAGWTKNEGLLFLLVSTTGLMVTLFLAGRKKFRRTGWFVAGLSIPLAAVACFKFLNTSRNELIRYYYPFSYLLNPERHRLIIPAVKNIGWTFGAWAVNPIIPLLGFILLQGICPNVFRRQSWRFCAVVLLTMAAGYYTVYLLTPVPLQIHLDSSLNRLLLQLWPSFLLLLALTCRPDKTPRTAQSTA